MAEEITKERGRLAFLLSPWAIFGGITSGVVIGFSSEFFSAKIAPFGDIYLSLLQMCILPILITAVISSLGRLLSSGEAIKYFGRIFWVFFLGLTLASALGMAAGLIIKPGDNLNKDAQATLGKMVSEVELYSKPTEGKPIEVLSFVQEIIPTNIFAAITQGKNLSILFFSILLGIALGLLKSESAKSALVMLDALYEAFLKIIGWLMYGLPLGLMCLFADQVSQGGLDMMQALFKLVILIYLCSLALMVVFSLAIWFSVGGSYFKSVYALREPLLVAVGTSSSFTAIPSMLRGLQNELKLNKNMSSLVVPLGTSLNPPGTVLHFTLASLFIAEFYGVSLGGEGLLIVMLGSIAVGVAAGGVPGIAALGMIALILEPLGLPVKVAIILLVAIDPFLDPILTAVNVQANCAATALITRKSGKS